MSAREAINDKLQGSAATRLRCREVVNNQIKKGLLLSVWVKFFNNRWTSGKVTSKSMVVSCTLHAWPTHCYKTKKVHETITFLLVTLPNVHQFKNFVTHRLSSKPFLIWLLTTPLDLKYVPTPPCNLLLRDATAVPKRHQLLPHLNPDWLYLSDTGLPRLSWKTGR